jgi:hypothetical protein
MAVPGVSWRIEIQGQNHDQAARGKLAPGQVPLHHRVNLFALAAALPVPLDHVVAIAAADRRQEAIGALSGFANCEKIRYGSALPSVPAPVATQSWPGFPRMPPR